MMHRARSRSAQVAPSRFEHESTSDRSRGIALNQNGEGSKAYYLRGISFGRAQQ